jgi:hypothetical protein
MTDSGYSVYIEGWCRDPWHGDAHLRRNAHAQAAREPDAWQWRACIGDRWGSWILLDRSIEHFRRVGKFNLDNGTYEVRPLYAHVSDAAAEARNNVIEECAKVVDGYGASVDFIADGIRALARRT